MNRLHKNFCDNPHAETAMGGFAPSTTLELQAVARSGSTAKG